MAFTSQIILYQNSMLLKLNGLRDSEALPGVFLNAATVTVTLKDSAGAEVSGETWPLTLDYIAASDGNYSATLTDTLGVTLSGIYDAEITVDGGAGLKAFWVMPLVVKKRKFT